jgi:hypothetical protein
VTWCICCLTLGAEPPAKLCDLCRLHRCDGVSRCEVPGETLALARQVPHDLPADRPAKEKPAWWQIDPATVGAPLPVAQAVAA